jgi:hypothetical protein
LRAHRPSIPQEIIRIDSRLLQDRSERALRHVAWMIWDRGKTPRAGIEPDLMATGGLAVELKTAPLQLPNDLSVSESR